MKKGRGNPLPWGLILNYRLRVVELPLELLLDGLDEFDELLDDERYTEDPLLDEPLLELR